MDTFDDDEVALIVRRAVQLDADRVDGHPAGQSRVDRASLVHAATEVGIERTAIELAIAEHAVGPLPRGGRLDGLFGPRQSVASRRVDLPSDQAEAAISLWLSRAQFRPQRREAQLAVWYRRTDLAANAMRLANSISGGDRFQSTPRVEVRAVPVDATSSLVRVSGDRAGTRTRALVASSGFLAVGTTAVIAGVVAIPALAVNALPCAAAAAGIAFYSRRRSDRAASELDRLLDQVAAGEQPSLLGRVRAAPRLRSRVERPRASAPSSATRPSA